MTTRLEAEKFTGHNDYGLWKIKIRAVLIQQGLAALLAPIDPANKGKGSTLDEKAQVKFDEMQLKAHSAVILHLGDKVLRDVQEQRTATEVLVKLDEIYLAKSVANRMYMKKRLYSYSFLDDKSIVDQLEDFNKMIDDLGMVDVKISDEDTAILALNALPSKYDQLRDAILYGRDKPITYAEVHAALMAKELQRGMVRNNMEAQPESLNIKKFKKLKYKKKEEESKTPTSEKPKESRTCHWCKKPGHLKKDCYAWKKKQAAEGQEQSNNTDVAQGSEKPPQALNIMEKGEDAYWILDSGCSFHMCPYPHWFEAISDASGSVVLGNNQTCNIKGIGSVRFFFV